jgi:hypothetical protein
VITEYPWGDYLVSRRATVMIWCILIFVVAPEFLECVTGNAADGCGFELAVIN